MSRQRRKVPLIIEEYSATHGEPMTKHEMLSPLKLLKAGELRLILRGLRFDTARYEENIDLRTMVSRELRRRQCRLPEGDVSCRMPTTH